MKLKKSNLKGYLNSGSWHLGKTAVIRVPEILKEKVVQLAKILDSQTDYESSFQAMIQSDKQIDNSSDELKAFKKQIEKLHQKLAEKQEIIKTLEQKPRQHTSANKYKIARQCFLEFLVSQKLNLDEISKSRKGTKKHQLFTIYEWFNQLT